MIELSYIRHIQKVHANEDQDIDVDRIGQTKRPLSQRSMAKSLWQRGERFGIPTFFIRIAARCRRIRKRPKRVPLPQLYAYKTEKLQELERLYAKREISLFYDDESHVCTEGYVPYGWQFSGEDVFVPSERTKRLNIFGMIDHDNHFEGFCTSESIDAGKVVDFFDTYFYHNTIGFFDTITPATLVS